MAGRGVQYHAADGHDHSREPARHSRRRAESPCARPVGRGARDLGRDRQLQDLRGTGRVPRVAAAGVRCRPGGCGRRSLVVAAGVGAPLDETPAGADGADAGEPRVLGRHQRRRETRPRPAPADPQPGYADAAGRRRCHGGVPRRPSRHRRRRSPGRGSRRHGAAVGTALPHHADRSGRPVVAGHPALAGQSALAARHAGGRDDDRAEGRRLGGGFVHGGVSRRVQARGRNGRAVLPVLGRRGSLQTPQGNGPGRRSTCPRPSSCTASDGAGGTRGACRFAPFTGAPISTSGSTGPDGSERFHYPWHVPPSSVECR